MAAPGSSPAKQALSKVDKTRRFYLLHGDDEAMIESAKDQIISAHLTREEREENYIELPRNGGTTTLKKELGDVLSELCTVSFLPGVSRVVSLYNASDFFDAKSKTTSRKKAADAAAKPGSTASDHLLDFLKKEMPTLPAVLIVIVLEDYEKFKKVSPANPVVQYAQNQSAVYCFKDDNPQFLFFDALFARQTERALQLWRQWLQRAPGSPRPYMQLATQLRLLIQAKTAASSHLQQRGLTKKDYLDKMMPHEYDKSFQGLKPEFRKEKLVRSSGNFSFQELLTAYEKLMPLQKYAIPSSTDRFVPDRERLAEMWILEFFSRPQARPETNV